MKKLIVTVTLAACATAFAGKERYVAPHGEIVEIWPKGQVPLVCTNQTYAPYMEFFRPAKVTTDAFLIVTPGGGYGGVAYEGEGFPVQNFCMEKGLNMAILKYRTPRPIGKPMYLSAWQDVQRAIRVARSQAAARGYSPDKIGVMGFSAGGHLTILAATSSLTPAYEPVDELDDLPCHLNFAAPVYPAYLLEYPEGIFGKRGEEVDCPLSGLLKFDDKTPPMCFIHGDDDGHSAVGSLRVYEQIRRMKIRGEVHVFSGVNHGFGGSVRHGFNPSGWEILVNNFAASLGLTKRTDAFRWPDEE